MCVTSSDLPDDDPVRPHPQRRSEQVADAYRVTALGVRWPCLHLHDMHPLELKLSGVLDDHDALPLRNIGRQRVEHRRLAAAGSSRHEHVHLGRYERLQRERGVVGQSAEPDETLDGDKDLVRPISLANAGPL